MVSHPTYAPMRHKKQYATAKHTIQFINYFNQRARTCKPYHKKTWKNKALLTFVLWRTGRRISEITGIPNQPQRAPGLRPADIDQDNNTIDFYILKKMPVRSYTKSHQRKKQSKIDKEKFTKQAYKVTLPYPKDLIDVLVEWCEVYELHPFERIFPITRHSVDRLYKQAAGDMNVRVPGKKVYKNKLGDLEERPYQFHVHMFRHGFSVNFLLKNSQDPTALAVLQDVLQHSDINVTKAYLNFNDKKHRNMLDKAAGGDVND